MRYCFTAVIHEGKPRVVRVVEDVAGYTVAEDVEPLDTLASAERIAEFKSKILGRSIGDCWRIRKSAEAAQARRDREEHGR